MMYLNAYFCYDNAVGYVCLASIYHHYFPNLGNSKQLGEHAEFPPLGLSIMSLIEI